MVFNFGAVLFITAALGVINACVLGTHMSLLGTEFIWKVGFMLICDI